MQAISAWLPFYIFAAAARRFPRAVSCHTGHSSITLVCRWRRVSHRLSGPDFGPYDLVTAYECLHDLPHPVPALAAMRRLAGRAGTVLTADMKAARQFTAPATTSNA